MPTREFFHFKAKFCSDRRIFQRSHGFVIAFHTSDRFEPDPFLRADRSCTCQVREGTPPKDAIAAATWKDAIEEIGWGYLKVETTDGSAASDDLAVREGHRKFWPSMGRHGKTAT